MTKQEIYVNIKSRLSALDLSHYWPEFHEYPFALYDRESVYMDGREFPCDDRFVANTTIEFEGENIAIWNLEYETDIDLDILTSNLVHEMFHAFQKDNGETRYPSDLKLLLCPMDADYFGLKQYENTILASIFVASPEEKRSALREFFGVRELRRRISDSIEQEFLVETTEGMAVFVGDQALMELSPVKFEEKIKMYCGNIGSYNENLFDLRQSCYYSGTLLLFIAADAGFDFRHKIGSTDITVDRIVEEMCGYDIPNEVVCDERVKLALNPMQEKNRKLNAVFKEGKKSVHGNWYICGYDPMNITRTEDEIYCSHFIMLHDCHTDEVVSIMDKTLLRMKHGSHNLVEEYWK